MRGRRDERKGDILRGRTRRGKKGDDNEKQKRWRKRGVEKGK